MLFPTSSHQDLCAMADKILAVHVNPLRLYSLTQFAKDRLSLVVGK